MPNLQLTSTSHAAAKALTLAAALIAALVAFPSCAMGQMLIGKECGRCGRAVGLAANVGQSCPHCGATWGSQQTEYRSGGGSGASSPPMVPIDPWLQRRQEWQSRLETRAAFYRKWAAERHEVIEANREEAREAAERFRETDDPVVRAQRYLASARLCDAEGATQAATAYRKLAARCLSAIYSPGHRSRAALVHLTSTP